MYIPNLLAFWLSHTKAGLDRDVINDPPEVKSMALPCSCIERPGIAVGGLHCEDGFW